MLKHYLLSLAFVLSVQMLFAQCYTATGAGETNANGYYTLSGTNISGGATYTHSSGLYFVHYNDWFGEWSLNQSTSDPLAFPMLYRNFSFDPNNLPLTGWMEDMGTAPAPTFSSGCVSDEATLSASVNPVCNGNSAVLMATGTLDQGDNWYWYTGSCGGTAVGTGTSITVSPSADITYYCRSENPGTGFVGTSCANILVTVTPTQGNPLITGCPFVNGSSADLQVGAVSGASYYWGTEPNMNSWATVGDLSGVDDSPVRPALFFHNNQTYLLHRNANAKPNLTVWDGNTWSQLGSTNSTTYWVINDMEGAMDNAGNLYVVFQDNTITADICAKKFDGTNWVNLGASEEIYTAPAGDMQIALHPATQQPYVFFESGGSGIVRRFDGSTWQNVGAVNFTGNNPSQLSMAFHPVTHELYVLFRDANNGGKATVMRYNGTTWVLEGTAGFSNPIPQYGNRTSIAFDPTTNQPQITFTDSNNGDRATWMGYNGTTWQVRSTAGFNGEATYYHFLKYHPVTNEPYFSYYDNSGNSVDVLRYDGSNWQPLGAPNFASGAITSGLVFHPTTYEPHIVTTGNAQNGYRPEVFHYNLPLGTSNTFSTAQPDDYYMEILYSNGCLVQASNNPFTVGATGGGATGTFTHSATGSYTWIDGNTYTASNNTATYTYVGGAANGCDSVVTLNLTIVSTPLTATVTKTNNTCNGACAGTATVTAAGGAMPYTYLWSNGQTTQTATGLCYGAYNVVVTDAVGNTKQVSFINILQPSAINVTPTLSHADCVTQGSISVVASGGTGAKTFLWSTGATTASITGLNGTTYGLTVTDAAGCQKTFSYFVDDLCYVISISKNDINTCTATCTGDATVTVTDGVAPYTYLWSNGQTTATATGLCKQNYRVTVTDANNIVRTGTVSIAFSQLAATYTATQPTCNGGCNGSATVLPTGAQAPYTFVWNSNAGSQTTQTATGLCVGAYNVTITSANGCTIVKKFINVGQPPAISLTTSSTPASCANDGTAIVSVTNGVAPLTYAWSNGGSTADIASLAPGTYVVTVTDANGCMKTKSVTVGTTCGAKPTENGDLLAEESILDESMPTDENIDINETLRMNDFALVDAFNVYPNPNQGQFVVDIQLIAETDARLRIHDVLGRTLLEQNLQGQSFQVAVDAKAWTSGAYFVQLISPYGQTTRKVVIVNE